MPMIKPCEYCRSEFFSHPSQRRRFCSDKCYRASGVNRGKANHRVPLADRLWASVRVGGPDECWPYTRHINGSGYGMIGDGIRRGGLITTHRAAYLTKVGPIPDGLSVLHKCDNPACCNPDHLWLGTHADNMADMARKGRAGSKTKPFGEANPASKLTSEQAREIRAAPGSHRAIAKLYNVSAGTVQYIKSGRGWKCA